MKNNENVILCYDKKDLSPIYFTNEDRYLHTQIIGPTGTGKTSQMLLPLIFQDINNDLAGITVVDPKGDMAEDLYKMVKEYFPKRKVVYVDPISSESPKYNPLEGDLLTVTSNMIEIFSPPIRIKSIKDKHDVDSIRMFITRTLKLAYIYPELVDNDLNLKTYFEFISNNHNKSRSICSSILNDLYALNRKGNPSKETLERITLLEWINGEYFENKNNSQEKVSYLLTQIQDIISNPYLSETLTPKRNDTNKIDFSKSISEGDIVIINSRNTELQSLSKIFGEFLLLEYQNSIFGRYRYEENKNPNYSREDVRPAFLFIDEFPTFSPIIIDLFTQGRSFKTGVHIVYQNRSLLETSGNADTKFEALSIEANARNIILFPGLNGSDADYFSENFSNLKKDEIIYRPFGQIVYRIVSDKTLQLPKIGLVFFLNETPSFDSVEKELI